MKIGEILTGDADAEAVTLGLLPPAAEALLDFFPAPFLSAKSFCARAAAAVSFASSSARRADRAAFFSAMRCSVNLFFF